MVGAGSGVNVPPAEAVEEGLLAEPPVEACDFESDGGTSSPGPAEEPTRRHLGLPRSPRALVVGALGTALLLGCAAAAVRLRRQPTGPEAGDVEDSVGLGLMGSILSTMADGTHQAAEVSESIERSYHSFESVGDHLNESAGKFAGLMHDFATNQQKRQEMIAKFKSLNQTRKDQIKKKLFKRFNITSLKQLRPKAWLHKGGACEHDEEEFGGLCYKRCSLLTGGHFPNRMSAWECCQGEVPCSSGFKISFNLCGGLSVAGDEVGGGCPHQKGLCLKNEELWAGTCYKRCEMLTYRTLPVRAGPATCCKDGDHNFLDFLDTTSCDTQSNFYAGGGEGDGGNAAPSQPHLPILFEQA